MNTVVVNNKKEYVQAILVSTDWDIQHRKHFLREVLKETNNWTDNVIIQQPVCLAGHFFTQFKRKILGLLKGNYKTKVIENGAILFSPIIIFNYSLWTRFRFMAFIDSLMMKQQINSFLKKNYPCKKIIFWVFYPCHFFLIDKVKHNFLVYDHYDNFDYDPSGTKLENDTFFNDLLIKKCDLILCLAKTVYERVKKLNNKAYYLRSGCDFETLTRPTDNNIPDEFLNINYPVIGFFGNIRHWMDFDLLNGLVNELPKVIFVFIGYLNRDSKKEFKKLMQYSNVLWIPYTEQNRATLYLKRFNCGIIPFKINKFMEGVFPNKFYEYMAMEIPIVTTALPDLKEYSDIIGYSTNHKEFLDNCLSAIEGNYEDKVKMYKKIAQENSWENTAKIYNNKLKESLKFAKFGE